VRTSVAAGLLLGSNAVTRTTKFSLFLMRLSR
jgi:hypothetical protein